MTVAHAAAKDTNSFFGMNMLDNKTKTDIVELLKDFRECSICSEPFEPVQTELNATQYACPDCVSKLFTRDSGCLKGWESQPAASCYRGDSTLDD